MSTFYNQATLTYGANGVNKVTSNITRGQVMDALSMHRMAAREQYHAGDTVMLTVHLVNNMETDLNELTVEDDLGAYAFGEKTLTPLTYIPNSLRRTEDGVPQTAPVLAGTSPLRLTGVSVPANGEVILSYLVQVNEFAPLGEGAQITSKAKASDATPAVLAEKPQVITANTEAQLSIVKSVAPTAVPEDGEVVYTFLIQNMGAEAVGETNGLSIADTFVPPLTEPIVQSGTKTWVKTDDYTYDTTSGEFVMKTGKLVAEAAYYEQDPSTGAWSVTPGEAVLTVTGNIS